MSVGLELALNGTVRSKISDITLTDGWRSVRTHDGRQAFLCEECVAGVRQVSG